MTTTDVSCPVCFAPPDEWCSTPDGRMRKDDHKARVKARNEALSAGVSSSEPTKEGQS